MLIAWQVKSILEDLEKKKKQNKTRRPECGTEAEAQQYKSEQYENGSVVPTMGT